MIATNHFEKDAKGTPRLTSEKAFLLLFALFYHAYTNSWKVSDSW